MLHDSVNPNCPYFCLSVHFARVIFSKVIVIDCFEKVVFERDFVLVEHRYTSTVYSRRRRGLVYMYSYKRSLIRDLCHFITLSLLCYIGPLTYLTISTYNCLLIFKCENIENLNASWCYEAFVLLLNYTISRLPIHAFEQL